MTEQMMICPNANECSDKMCPGKSNHQESKQCVRGHCHLRLLCIPVDPDKPELTREQLACVICTTGQVECPLTHYQSPKDPTCSRELEAADRVIKYMGDKEPAKPQWLPKPDKAGQYVRAEHYRDDGFDNSFWRYEIRYLEDVDVARTNAYFNVEWLYIPEPPLPEVERLKDKPYNPFGSPYHGGIERYIR
jgi:hypothetical protein